MGNSFGSAYRDSVMFDCDVWRWRRNKNHSQNQMKISFGFFLVHLSVIKTSTDQNTYPSFMALISFWEMFNSKKHCSKWMKMRNFIKSLEWNRQINESTSEQTKQKKSSLQSNDRTRRTKVIKKVCSLLFGYLTSHVSAHLIVCPATK